MGSSSGWLAQLFLTLSLVTCVSGSVLTSLWSLYPISANGDNGISLYWRNLDNEAYFQLPKFYGSSTVQHSRISNFYAIATGNGAIFGLVEDGKSIYAHPWNREDTALHVDLNVSYIRGNTAHWGDCGDGVRMFVYFGSSNYNSPAWSRVVRCGEVTPVPFEVTVPTEYASEVYFATDALESPYTLDPSSFEWGIWNDVQLSIAESQSIPTFTATPTRTATHTLKGCSSFQCPTGFGHKARAQDIVCTTPGCDASMCCDVLMTWSIVGSGLPQDTASGGMVVFNNLLWFIGGRNNTATYLYNLIYRSVDGLAWQTFTPTTGFSPRCCFGYAVYNFKIYLMGTGSPAPVSSEVVSSDTTGAFWASKAAPWRARSSPAAVVFDSKLWLIGGDVNDIWNYNGTTWAKVSSLFNFSAGAMVVVYNSKMWLFGGTSFVSGLFVSSDGMTWTPTIFDGLRPPARARHMMVVVNDRICIFGGINSTSSPDPAFRDVWSTDGLTWRQEGNLPQTVAEASAVVWNRQVIFAGGFVGNPRSANRRTIVAREPFRTWTSTPTATVTSLSCAFFVCPNGYRRKSFVSDIFCNESGCNASLCCECVSVCGYPATA